MSHGDHLKLLSNKLDDAPSDAELARRVRAGDAAAFENVFRTYYEMLCDVAALIVRSYDVGEEIVADVFARVWERRAEWHPDIGIRAYLLSAVRNRSFNALRDTGTRKARIAAIGEDEPPGMGSIAPAPDGRLEAESVATRLWETVATLPPITQMVLTLRWKHGLSWDAVADAAGMSPSAVQMQFVRARRVLRARLAQFID